MLLLILLAFVEYVRPHDVVIREGKTDRRFHVVDFCHITRRKDGNIDFALVTNGANGHTCEMEGTAIHVKGHYEYTEILEAYPEKPRCVLRIEFTRKRAIVTDVGNTCSRAWCGARARIGRTEFRRSKTRR